MVESINLPATRAQLLRKDERRAYDSDEPRFSFRSYKRKFVATKNKNNKKNSSPHQPLAHSLACKLFTLGFVAAASRFVAFGARFEQHDVDDDDEGANGGNMRGDGGDERQIGDTTPIKSNNTHRRHLRQQRRQRGGGGGGGGGWSTNFSCRRPGRYRRSFVFTVITPLDLNNRSTRAHTLICLITRERAPQ